jgi:hypothetical protein
MITIGQVFYLLNSRYLLDSSLSLTAHLGNKYLPLGIARSWCCSSCSLMRRRCNDCSTMKPFGSGMAYHCRPVVLPCRGGGEAVH